MVYEVSWGFPSYGVVGHASTDERLLAASCRQNLCHMTWHTLSIFIAEIFGRKGAILFSSTAYKKVVRIKIRRVVRDYRTLNISTAY